MSLFSFMDAKGISVIILTEVAEGSEIKRLVSHSGNYHEVAEGLEIKGISVILTEVPKAWKLKGLVPF